MSYRGEERVPLDLSGLAGDRRRFPRREGVQAIAVCLLHAYADPCARAGASSPRSKRLWPRSRSSPRTRSRASGASTSGARPPCSRPTSSRSPGATWSASRRGSTGADYRRPALRHAVELRHRLARRRPRDPDHHGRIRAGLGRLGRGRARPHHRRAERARARHRRHHREVLADRERSRQDHDRLLDRALAPLVRLSDHGAGGRPRRDRQWRRLDRLGRRFRQAPCRPALGRRVARPGRLRPRRHRGDHHRRQPRARPDRQGLLLRRRLSPPTWRRSTVPSTRSPQSSASTGARRRAASSASPTTT